MFLSGCIFAAVMGAQAAPAKQEYKAKLGTPYLVGTVGRTAGEKKVTELGNSRLITLNSVRTALSFGTKRETIVARQGKMLVILGSTIKNPEKKPILVSDASCFALRCYEPTFKASDVDYRGSALKNGDILSQQLKPGQAIDVWSVYEFPEQIPHLKIGIYFHTFIASQTPRFDVTNLIEKPTSVFAQSSLRFNSSAQVGLKAKFDLDSLNFRVLEVKKVSDGGIAVRIEASNDMILPERWGWQYAQAQIEDSSGRKTTNYPDFYIDSAYSDWGMNIQPRKSITGEYRFYPSNQDEPVKFSLTMNSTKRSVMVLLK